MQRAILLALVLNMFTTHQAWSTDKWLDLKREGQRLEVAGSYKLAEKFYMQAAKAALKGPGHENVTRGDQIELLYRVANIHLIQGRFWDAEIFYQKLVGMAREDKKKGTLDHEALVWMEDLAESYDSSIKGWLEPNALEHALVLRDLISGDNNRYMATTLRRLTQVLVNENKCHQAEPYARRLCRLTSKFTGPAELVKGNDLFLLSVIEFRIGQYLKAETNARQAVAIASKLEIPPGLCTSNCRLQLSKILIAQREFNLAEQEAQKALKILERNNGKNLEVTYPVREVMAEIKIYRGNYPEAIRIYTEIISALQAKYGAQAPILVHELENLKAVYIKKKDRAKAAEIAKRIEAISKKGRNEKTAHGH